jgi:hypothetical protein
MRVGTFGDSTSLFVRNAGAISTFLRIGLGALVDKRTKFLGHCARPIRTFFLSLSSTLKGLSTFSLIINTVARGTTIRFVVWTSSDLVIAPLFSFHAETVLALMLGIGGALDFRTVFESVSTLSTFALDLTLRTSINGLTVNQLGLAREIWALDRLFLGTNFLL